MAKVIFLLLILITLGNNALVGNNTNSQYYSTEDSMKIIEKVYLHVDRDMYSPGDDIWFKGYLIDATTRLLTDHSYNLHVELISPDSKIIESRIVRLNEGLGNGDFHLSKIIKSGRYSLRAYTNYMRNFGDQLFFVKDITIIDLSAASKAFSDSVINVKKKLEISFFPEGGSLVDNVQSIVGFKAVDAFGAGCDVSGNLYSSAGELMTTFKTDHNGMGSFTVTPVLGVDYYTIVKNLNGDEVKSDLPRCFQSGLVLNISKNQTNELEVMVRTNTETYASLSDQDLSLTISAHGLVYKTVKFKIQSCNNSLHLSTDGLPDGIVILTISRSDNKPLCERLVYIQNNDDIKINLETDKSTYKQRDSISVKISLSDNYAIAPEAYASFSAAEDISTNGTSRFPSTICSWFLLESDVRGPVEEPSYYFDPSNPNRLKDLDLLLLTQGWRDFEWKYKTLVFPPENGFTISGRVRKKITDKPLIHSMVNIAIFKTGKPFIGFVPVDSSGRFSLKGVDMTGNAKIVASVTGEKDNLKGWLLLDSLKYSPAIVTAGIAQTRFARNDDRNADTNLVMNENMLSKKSLHTYIQYSETRNTIQKKYKLSDTITPGEVNIIATRQDKPESARAQSRRYLRGTPDIELVITPDLRIYNNAFHLIDSRFINPFPSKRRLRLGHRLIHPLYMIDGNPVPKSEVEALPISWVARIDVVNDPASFAALQTLVEYEGIDSVGLPTNEYGYADGAISIILKDDKDIVNNSVYHTVNVKFSGFSEPRIFYSPQHHTSLQSDYKPDVRTTLLWEPNLRLENNKDLYLNYYNADNSATIKINVEGITTTGIPVTGSVTYKVQ
jgi:hypothetical protein